MRQNVVYEYVDTNLLYRLAKEIGGQFLQPSFAYNAKEAKYTSGAEGTPVTLGSTSIETSPDTAFQIYGLAMSSFMNTVQEPTGSSSLNYQIIAQNYMTYYQPKPPASDSTTIASQTGNLAFRNKFWTQMMGLQEVWFNYGSASSGVAGGATQAGKMITVVLAEPITIVGEGIVVQAKAMDGLYNTFMACQSWVVGKYVHISTQQYVDLVALATGQAIMPPSILG